MTANRFRDHYRSKPGRPLILAHRGDSAHAPENTLEAARLGHEAGASGWEFDVRTTRDGVLVLLHDESLLRTTDVAARFRGDPRAALGFPVAEFTWDEVRTLDAGSWFLDPAGGTRSALAFGTLDRVDRGLFGPGPARIPGLIEALEWTRRLDWLANVEIKAARVGRVLGAIREAGAMDLVAVSSFDLGVMAEVARAEPSVATGALFDRDLGGPAAARLAEVGADALHVSARGFAGLGEADRSVPMLVYTVNEAGSPGLAARLALAGVAGLFTDDPASLASPSGFSRS